MAGKIVIQTSVWDRSFVTYRRYLLDQLLDAHKHLMWGVVFDLGGKRERTRGAFRPSEAQAWIYVNLDPLTAPHVLADISQLPMKAGSADCVLCCEVLEHVPNPGACVREIFRLLKPGGVLIASVPFLFPIHADPFDFNRFTEESIRHLLLSFTHVQIHQMGGYLGVLGMFLEMGSKAVTGWRPIRGMARRLAVFTGRLLCWYDSLGCGSSSLGGFTTGYFWVAIK